MQPEYMAAGIEISKIIITKRENKHLVDQGTKRRACKVITCSLLILAIVVRLKKEARSWWKQFIG